MGEYGISQSLPRFEDPKLLRGRGDFIDDENAHGQLHAVMLRSPHAHADIRSVDATAARAAPGVVAIFTGRDYVDSGWGPIPHIGPPVKRRGGADFILPPFHPLAVDRVRMVGEGVAFVVAESAAAARDAAEMIEIDYAPLAASADTATALDPGVPVVWPDIGSNEALVYEIGNRAAAEAAFADAPHIVEQRFVITRALGNALEMRCRGRGEEWMEGKTRNVDQRHL